MKDEYKITEGVVCIKCGIYSPDIAQKGKISGYICGKCNIEFEEKLKGWNKHGIYLGGEV
ncbi:MAG: hypothetical protein KKC68_06685 [Candidatus Thermoplasmatota archaeon]|nr:hypothetical protein [Candidatus Thermoplasmatota archaeon]